MSPTSPLVIIVYVIFAILLASTMLRRFAREKLITALLRSSPRNITRIIRSYRTIVKMYRILIVCYVVFILLLIYLHFGPENGEGFLLFVAGILALLLIKSIEDIQYRNTVIARLEAELPTVQEVDAASEKAFEQRARKWRIIALVIVLGHEPTARSGGGPIAGISATSSTGVLSSKSASMRWILDCPPTRAAELQMYTLSSRELNASPRSGSSAKSFCANSLPFLLYRKSLLSPPGMKVPT